MGTSQWYLSDSSTTDHSVYPANLDVIYTAVEVAPSPPSVKLAVHYPQFQICTLSFSLFSLKLLIYYQILQCIRLLFHTHPIVLQVVKSTSYMTVMQVR